ncbi:hypothetical protein TWF730_011075 [Orbilia blumenaviensis]|uniref:Pyranose 2-oxidase n=1 Tax=Orbilia blumenaviensis TaxID=1796055 RepID=A0AAV9UJM4_9PEZI
MTAASIQGQDFHAIDPPGFFLKDKIAEGTKLIDENIDVLIVGSGPIGATYARKLVESGRKVWMLEVGAQEHRTPGEHKKNAIVFQKDVNSFVNVIKGDLNLLSVPTSKVTSNTLNPVSYSNAAYIQNGQNPNQAPHVNLDNAAATRTVGGMAAHWTCATPRPHPKLELPDTYDSKRWDQLFSAAERLIGTSSDEFEDSIRQQLVKRTLQEAYADDDREFKALPLACKRSEQNKSFVKWSSTATVLGQELIDILKQEPSRAKKFELLDEHLCEKILPVNDDPKQVWGVKAQDLRTGTDKLIKAKQVVICAGAVLTPQILFNSGLDESLPALGKWLTEQTMTFCQIVLKKSLIEKVDKDPYHLGWKKIVEAHRKQFKADPLPFPFDDPDPQITTPVSDKYPWHTQIHRDAFSYGLVPPAFDQRVIVDLRWFGLVKPVESNCVTFEHKIKDMYGMPQPTFNYELSDEDAEQANEMMNDMTTVASKLGGYLPGAEPVFLPPGAALHICGTTRVGTSKTDSVVDENCKVWDFNNLYLGGCNVIPTRIACNPTLTAICYALVGAEAIDKALG